MGCLKEHESQIPRLHFVTEYSMCFLFVLEVFQGQWICGSHHGQSLLRSKAGAKPWWVIPKKVDRDGMKLWDVMACFCVSMFFFVSFCHTYLFFRSHAKLSGCLLFLANFSSDLWHEKQLTQDMFSHDFAGSCGITFYHMCSCSAVVSSFIVGFRFFSFSVTWHCPWFACQGRCYPGTASSINEIFMCVLSYLHGIKGK